MLDFIILYPIVWFFERKRGDVDGWNIAIAVGIPAVISIFVTVGAAVFEVKQIGHLINLVLFPLILGLCLWKITGLPGKRASVYPILYMLVSAVIGMILKLAGVIDAA